MNVEQELQHHDRFKGRVAKGLAAAGALTLALTYWQQTGEQQPGVVSADSGEPVAVSTRTDTETLIREPASKTLSSEATTVALATTPAAEPASGSEPDIKTVTEETTPQPKQEEASSAGPEANLALEAPVLPAKVTQPTQPPSEPTTTQSEAVPSTDAPDSTAAIGKPSGQASAAATGTDRGVSRNSAEQRMLERARLERKRRGPLQALASYRQVLFLYPRSQQGNIEIADIFVDLGNRSAAADHYARAAEISADSGDIQQTRVLVTRAWELNRSVGRTLSTRLGIDPGNNR